MEACEQVLCLGMWSQRTEVRDGGRESKEGGGTNEGSHELVRHPTGPSDNS